MREIKFRAYGQNEVHIEPTMLHFDLNEVTSGFMDGNWEIMQFTGLHDKNGKEIYEGDILEGSVGLGVPLAKVVWSDKESGWRVNLIADRQRGDLKIGILKSYLVVGNIYQYPELLEEEDNQ